MAWLSAPIFTQENSRSQLYITLPCAINCRLHLFALHLCFLFFSFFLSSPKITGRRSEVFRFSGRSYGDNKDGSRSIYSSPNRSPISRRWLRLSVWKEERHGSIHGHLWRQSRCQNRCWNGSVCLCVYVCLFSYFFSLFFVVVPVWDCYVSMITNSIA